MIDRASILSSLGMERSGSCKSLVNGERLLRSQCSGPQEDPIDVDRLLVANWIATRSIDTIACSYRRFIILISNRLATLNSSVTSNFHICALRSCGNESRSCSPAWTAVKPVDQ